MFIAALQLDKLGLVNVLFCPRFSPVCDSELNLNILLRPTQPVSVCVCVCVCVCECECVCVSIIDSYLHLKRIFDDPLDMMGFVFLLKEL